MRTLFRYKLIVEYDGTPFVGWQRQDTGHSVQSTIEDAIHQLLKEKVFVYGSGRTDAGVHATHQVAHFDSEQKLDTHKFVRSLNHFLKPHPIVVLDVSQATQDFHARFSAKLRKYRYTILNRSQHSVLNLNRAWHVRYPLDLTSMQVAAKHLIGTHDFTSFRAAHCQAKNAVRTIDEIKITPDGLFIHIDVSAQSFLHNQIRIIVALLAEIGRGKLHPDATPKILEAKSRKACPYTAPAHGLYYLGAMY